MRLRLGRCRISVSFYFFMLLALLGACGGSELLSGISAAAIHECGHIIALLLCTGDAVPVSFDITPFGLKLGIIPSGLDARREFIILSGGITANLAAAALFWGLGELFGSGLLMRHAAAGVCMAAVNAAMVQPLDGGRILLLALERVMDGRRAGQVCFAVSLVSLFLMASAGFFVMLRGRGNFSLLALTVWLAVRCLRGE